MVAIIYLVLHNTIFAQNPQQVVEILDMNLQRAIRQAVPLANNQPITRGHLRSLTHLKADRKGIKDITGLEYAINLRVLDLAHNSGIKSIKPLTSLTKLTQLDAGGCEITDIAPVRNLTNLVLLDFGRQWGLRHDPQRGLVDIEPLSNLTKLRTLNLSFNRISDIKPLTNLTELTWIALNSNQIVDVRPLANLVNLNTLFLQFNGIVDVSPLANLLQLEELGIASNPILDFSPLLELEGVELDIEISDELNEEFNTVVEVPDPNLRVAIRKALQLPDDIPLTQLQMLRLGGLDAGGNRGIADLTGLEYAVNLSTLGLHQNPIVDINILAHLTNLERFNLWGCQIVDLTPLRNLKNLRWIHLGGNEISDISPLSELTNLTFLDLRSNQIVDVRPLANLVNLKTLKIENNLIVDHSPLDALDLVEFTLDECCEEPRISINERLENRTFPSIFSAWGGIGWSTVLNLKHESDLEQMARHDLWFGGSGFGLRLRRDGEGVIKAMGEVNRARQERDEFLAMNPNMIFLIEIRMKDWHPSALPSDSPYWVRDEQGNPIPGWNDTWLLDFTHPDIQDEIVNSAIAVSKCGLWDGVMFDWWNEKRSIIPYRTIEQERTARLNIVRRIRESTGDDFLLICNGNRRIFPITGPYINGTFMETLRDNDSGYTYEGLTQIENSLTWAEENLREPRINALEGWGITSEPLDSPINLRWMRVFTTMGLTHSDGYVLYTDGVGHGHYWYDFWDADLGRPVGEKGAQYQNRDGLFIREFTNGWAVYNRSGETQQVELSEDSTSVASGEQGRIHFLPDLDGEIYLKVANQSPWDVNQDGITDIFDLIAVAKNFGKDHPDTDLNGDGAVDIFDLVLVAKHLGDSTNPAAPVIGANSHLLSSKTVQGWIDMAYVVDDGSIVFRQGIANLERLLTMLVPDKTVLLSNYPNPFNPETWIPYHLAADADVTIAIYSLRGDLVRQLDLGMQEAGYYVDMSRAAYWDGKNEDGESVASGVYFIKMEAGKFIASKRMVVVK